MKLKVIGAGYGRTGTKSLQLALEKLGFNKCYHMEELIRNPEGVQHWKNAYNEKPVDWDTLFQDYQAIVDFPGSMYYKQLFAHYPEAKVILTIRDPEKWYESVSATIHGFDPGIYIKMRMMLAALFSSKARNLFQVMMLNEKSIWAKFFEGKFKDKAYAIQRFNDHIEDVKSTVPQEQLLIFEAKDGWKPLCAFLGKEVPSEPYPQANKKENFPSWAIGIVNEVLG